MIIIGIIVIALLLGILLTLFGLHSLLEEIKNKKPPSLSTQPLYDQVDLLQKIKNEIRLQRIKK